MVQSVAPGCTLHSSVHFVSQSDEHSAAQPLPVQLAEHPAEQSDLQWSLHENVVGVVVHAVTQLDWQVDVQETVAGALHFVEQVDVKLTGVHCDVHPPAVSKWHVVGSTMVTTVPSLVLHVVAADAFEVARSDIADARRPKEKVMAESFMVVVLA